MAMSKCSTDPEEGCPAGGAGAGAGTRAETGDRAENEPGVTGVGAHAGQQVLLCWRDSDVRIPPLGADTRRPEAGRREQWAWSLSMAAWVSDRTPGDEMSWSWVRL